MVLALFIANHPSFSNDEVWRRQRKMYHVRLNVKTANTYLPYQHFDSLQLMNDFLEEPSNWVGHLQRYTASIASGVLYGWRTPKTDTGYVKDLIEVHFTLEGLEGT
jgi:hypothetical protein